MYPSKPLETINQRYLNCEHAPIMCPLKKSMQIELHNDTYFHPRTSNMQAKPSNKPSMHIDNLVFKPRHTKLTTVNEHHKNMDNKPHIIDTTTIIDMP